MKKSRAIRVMKDYIGKAKVNRDKTPNKMVYDALNEWGNRLIRLGASLSNPSSTLNHFMSFKCYWITATSDTLVVEISFPETPDVTNIFHLDFKDYTFDEVSSKDTANKKDYISAYERAMKGL